MAEVRMDIDQAQETITTLGNTQQSFGETIAALSTSVEALLSVWKGTAPQQFQGAWESWLNTLRAQVEQLDPLRQGLVAEREQIIEADTTSNFG